MFRGRWFINAIRRVTFFALEKWSSVSGATTSHTLLYSFPFGGIEEWCVPWSLVYQCDFWGVTFFALEKWISVSGATTSHTLLYSFPFGGIEEWCVPWSLVYQCDFWGGNVFCFREMDICFRRDHFTHPTLLHTPYFTLRFPKWSQLNNRRMSSSICGPSGSCWGIVV